MTTTAKTTKSPKPKMLRLTSRAKSPKNAKKAQAAARAEVITEELVEAGTCPAAAPVVAELIAQAPAPLDLDGTAEAPTMADVIGESAPHAEAQSAVEPEPEAKEPETDPTADKLVALLTRPEGATVEQMMDATGLSRGGLRKLVNGKIRNQFGYRLDLEKIPNTSPARFVYRATKEQGA